MVASTKELPRLQSCGRFDELLPLLTELDAKEAELQKDAKTKADERKKIIAEMGLEITADHPQISIDEQKYDVIKTFQQKLKTLIKEFNENPNELTNDEINQFTYKVRHLIDTFNIEHKKILETPRNTKKARVNNAVKNTITVGGFVANVTAPPTLITKAAAVYFFSPYIKKANQFVRDKLGVSDLAPRSYRILQEMDKALIEVDRKLLIECGRTEYR